LPRISFPHIQGWTRISRLQIPREAGDAISSWSIGQLVSCRLVKRGEVNHNYVIKTVRGKYVLRQVFHSHHKNTRDLKFELSYLDYLRNAGFPYDVPSAIPTRNGGLFVTVQGHYYWLYNYLEGTVTSKLKESRLTQLARMTATYHVLVERSNLNNEKPPLDIYNRTAILKEIEDFRTEIQRGKRTTKNELTFLAESAKLTRMLGGLDERPYSNLGRYPIHRDLIPENLIWKLDKLVGVIDFENVSGSNDPVVKDIAVTMQYCCRDKKSRYQLDIDLAKRFLQSYKKHRSLSDKEIRLIPDLITAGFVEDFAYVFWMLRNDPKRANPYRLSLYSKAAQWSHSNREMIARALLN
jgi:Ser/Thr protein kinase RdoA (MazF antagonist)